MSNEHFRSLVSKNDTPWYHNRMITLETKTGTKGGVQIDSNGNFSSSKQL